MKKALTLYVVVAITLIAVLPFCTPPIQKPKNHIYILDTNDSVLNHYTSRTGIMLNDAHSASSDDAISIKHISSDFDATLYTFTTNCDMSIISWKDETNKAYFCRAKAGFKVLVSTLEMAPVKF